MKKIKLGAKTMLYPLPTFLVGANVGGKPNFMAVAWGGVACSNPPMLTVALQHHRFTYRGIQENGTLSVNVPSAGLVKETDYCGLVTGEMIDKSVVCGFKVFYGELKTAPLIEQCPINLECRLAHTYNLGTHALLIGQIEEVHASEECLSQGEPDILKVNPLIFSFGMQGAAYYSLGPMVAEAFKAGEEINKPKN
jgi:flavin reductase (DIM6/NTAB) family NADH-FMN oxidoreductase RutF